MGTSDKRPARPCLVVPEDKRCKDPECPIVKRGIIHTPGQCYFVRNGWGPKDPEEK